jgi:hypothetical protein
VFEAICKNEFQFLERVDALAVRVELSKLGVDKMPFGPELAQLKRNFLTLEAELVPTKRRLVEVEGEKAVLERRLSKDQMLEFRAESGEQAVLLEFGEKLSSTEAQRAKAMLRRRELPRAKELLMPFGVAGLGGPYAAVLRGWVEWVTKVTLVKKWEGRSRESFIEFSGLTAGRSRTVGFGQSENGKPIFGGYLHVAWHYDWTEDRSGESRYFMLKNRQGLSPVRFPVVDRKFAAKDNGEWGFHWEDTEPYLCVNDGDCLLGKTHRRPGRLEDTVGCGPSVFTGDGTDVLRVRRFDRWQLE